MTTIVGIVFFIALLVCGSSIDLIFDDWRAAVIMVIASIVVIACAAVLADRRDY